MSEALAQFNHALSSGGLHAALALLNSRTPHRYTGVYRYDGDQLRNVALFDRFSPELERGEDAPMVETFCALVARVGGSLEVNDGRTDSRFPWMQANPVVYYCGVQILEESGEPFGTLCHFDLLRCETRSGELPLMAAAAPLLRRAIRELEPQDR